jgi:hypothetical protein
METEQLASTSSWNSYENISVLQLLRFHVVHHCRKCGYGANVDLNDDNAATEPAN